MGKSPTISIVVVNYNTSDLLSGALESIVSTVGDLHVDIVVIDNASTDGGFSRLDKKFERDPRFSFVQNQKNIGLTAMNIMLERTKGKYIVTLDPDARLHANALQLLVAFLETTPQAGAVTANLLNTNGSMQRYIRRLMTPTLCFFTTIIGRAIDKYLLGLHHYKWYHYDDVSLAQITEIEQPSVTCLMFRREVCGPYIVDPDTLFYFTDVGLCKCIYNHDYKIYLVPEATATHLKSTSFKKANNTWREREYYRSLFVYLKKHYPASAPVMAVVLWLDRVMRAFLEHTIGHVPMR